MDAEASRPAPTPRVALVHAQTRRTLLLAGAFAMSAALTTVVPHRTGAWLPLHLFLAGSLVLAISGATRLFVVTWSAADPVTGAPVYVQRWLCAFGAAGIALGRELDGPKAVPAGAGVLLVAGLALLLGLLVVEGARGRVRRFHPALRFYLVGIAFGIVGGSLGGAMVAAGSAVRDAHAVVNLLGFVGIVIAGTLPSFVATQGRMKMSRRATPRRLNATLVLLTCSVSTAAIAGASGHPRLVTLGLLTYAAALAHLLTVLPRPAAKQLGWAGPRLIQIGLGVAWWIGVVVAAAVDAWDGGQVLGTRLAVTLALGGYAQILLGSVAYLVPVLLGGGHERLAAGFTATRSWPAVLATNTAVVAWIVGAHELMIVAVVATAADATVRAIRLRLRMRAAARAITLTRAPGRWL